MGHSCPFYILFPNLRFHSELRLLSLGFSRYAATLSQSIYCHISTIPMRLPLTTCRYTGGGLATCTRIWQASYGSSRSYAPIWRGGSRCHTWLQRRHLYPLASIPPRPSDISSKPSTANMPCHIHLPPTCHVTSIYRERDKPHLALCTLVLIVSFPFATGSFPSFDTIQSSCRVVLAPHLHAAARPAGPPHLLQLSPRVTSTWKSGRASQVGFSPPPPLASEHCIASDI